jgi:hypothetical protein
MPNEVKLVDENNVPISAANPLDIGAALVVGDIEIGAVELKDGATDTRVKVGAGSALVTGDNAMAVADPTGNALIGALTETAPASDTASSGLNGRLQRIAQRLTSVLTGIVLAAGTAIIGKVGGITIEVSDEFARPADTTAYAVGDAIGATTSNTGTTPLRSIVVGAANGATGYLTKFRLMTDQAACVAVIRVHFYTVAAPATVIPGDNALMTLAWANRAQRIGSIDLPALATELGSNTAARAQDLTSRLAFQCDAADNKIYYRLETQTIFTPASGQSWFLALTADRNGA